MRNDILRKAERERESKKSLIRAKIGYQKNKEKKARVLMRKREQAIKKKSSKGRHS
jgi:hypothetical protein